MCDGFSEAFLAMAAGASEGVGALAGGYTAAASVGSALGSTAAFVGANAIPLAAAGLSGFSAMSQAEAQQRASAYQAQVFDNNARIANIQRSAAMDQGVRQAEQVTMESSRLVGQQKAGLTANGLDLSSGTAIDQLATTRFLSQQDVNTLQSNAARAAWGYQVQGQSDRTNADLSRWQARNNDPFSIGAMSVGHSLLSSASAYARQGGG